MISNPHFWWLLDYANSSLRGKFHGNYCIVCGELAIKCILIFSCLHRQKINVRAIVPASITRFVVILYDACRVMHALLRTLSLFFVRILKQLTDVRRRLLRWTLHKQLLFSAFGTGHRVQSAVRELENRKGNI